LKRLKESSKINILNVFYILFHNTTWLQPSTQAELRLST